MVRQRAIHRRNATLRWTTGSRIAPHGRAAITCCARRARNDLPRVTVVCEVRRRVRVPARRTHTPSFRPQRGDIRRVADTFSGPMPGAQPIQRRGKEADMPRPASPTNTPAPPEACPHVDRNDPRCSGRFSLGRLDQAFTVCFGCFRGCPMYHRINRELHAGSEHVDATTDATTHATAHASQSPASLIALTAHGRDVPLRATGS